MWIQLIRIRICNTTKYQKIGGKFAWKSKTHVTLRIGWYLHSTIPFCSDVSMQVLYE